MFQFTIVSVGSNPTHDRSMMEYFLYESHYPLDGTDQNDCGSLSLHLTSFFNLNKWSALKRHPYLGKKITTQMVHLLHDIRCCFNAAFCLISYSVFKF